MQEIDQLFQECRNEIDSKSDNICFELGTDLFLSDRDSEEIKVLFNLIRLNIDAPEVQLASDSILTSDLRKISADELETVLKATEKAIDLPTISLREIKQDNARKISRILLNSDIKDSPYLSNKTAKKTYAASLFSRLSAFSIDTFIVFLLAGVSTYLLSEFYFSDTKGIADNLSHSTFVEIIPIINLYLLTLSMFFIIYPIISFLLFRHSLGSKICGIKIIGMEFLKVKNQQIIVRFLTLPLSILSFSFIKIISNKEALHEVASDSKFVKNI